MLRKFQFVSIAAFVGLGICTLTTGVPRYNTNPQMTSSYVLSWNFKHGRSNDRRQLFQWQYPQTQSQFQSTQTQESQTTDSNTSLPANTQESENWAGYIAAPSSGSSYTSVSGSWTVPNITATQQNAAAAQWIGLGGVSASDLLQMGTIEQMENGQPTAEIFWEQLPSAAQNVLSVPIGSTINASIAPSTDSSTTWNLTFTVNESDGQTQTQTVPVTLDSAYAQNIGSSAEWISEDPSSDNGQLYPLANMGTVTYSSATVNGQSLNSAGNEVQPVAMVSQNGNVMIAPSTIGSDGSFTTTVISTSNNSGSGSNPSFRRKSFPGSRWSRISRGRRGFGWFWEW